MAAQSCAFASRVSICRPRLALSASRRSHARQLSAPVRAKLSGPKPSSNTPNILATDVISSGLGAMVCTSFFVSRGQDPWTALSITVASAVFALALNRVMFDEER